MAIGRFRVWAAEQGCWLPEATAAGERGEVEFKGAFTENYVAEQLISTQLSPIYYYSSDMSRMEIDFVAQDERGVIPMQPFESVAFDCELHTSSKLANLS